MNNGSTDKYIDKVVMRYSKLFGLPSQKKILIYLFVLVIHGGIISILGFNFSLNNFIFGLVFGFSFFIITLLSDLVISQTLMKSDYIFNLRRCSALSFFSAVIWFGLVLLGVLIINFVGSSNLWIRFFILGFSGAVILRMLVFSVTSFVGSIKVILSSLLQPVLVLFSIFLMGSIVQIKIEIYILLLASISVSIAILTVFIFKYLMDSVGTGSLGIASSILFKAFLANWTEDLVDPLETFFEKLGHLKDINVSILSFSSNKKIKAVIVVPSVHPGPFKNFGSSLLPSMLQKSIQTKFNCVVSVPHGLVGHELDVASRSQTQKVVENIVALVGSLSPQSKATEMVRTESGDVKASCQLFGNYALLTLTTAPKTMEDLPPELNSFIINEAKKRQLLVLAIDAHNSMDKKFDLENELPSFREASVKSFEKALEKKISPLSVGASTIIPKDFTIQDGMGPGGISVILIEVHGKKAVYITIDGNNMVSGLREKILSSVMEMGIDNGEVLTTDTHSVCGMIRSPRGYNLVGEAINHSKLISYIKKATSNALNNLEPVKTSFRDGVISEVKVIGEKQIKELTVLADKTTERVKKVALILFPLAAVILTSLLFLL